MSVVEIARELVRTPSVTGDEDEIAHAVADRLDRHADVDLQPVEGFGPNVVARSARGPPEAPTVILNGHLDTVPVQGVWTQKPFEPEVERKRLYGLGACDMKGGDACILDAFERVASTVDLDLRLVLTVDEEGQCAGVFRYLESLEVDPDLVLVPEPTGEEVVLGARGRAAFDVTVRGRSGHGARPDDAVNAIDQAAEVVSSIRTLPTADHPTLPDATATPLKIRGGNYSLSVPDACTVTVDRHTVPPETAESVQDQLEDHLDGLGLAEGFDVEPIDRPTPFLEAYELSGSEPGVADLLEAYADHFAEEPPIAYAHSVGDFNAWATVAPTVVLGPKGGEMHAGDEWVSTESLYRVAGFYRAFLERYDEATTAETP